MSQFPIGIFRHEDSMATKPKDNAARAARDYMAGYDGPVIHRNVIFGTHLVKQIQKRDALLAARNSLFICFFARLAFGDNIIDPLEESLMSKVAKIGAKFEREIAQAHLVIKDCGISDDDLCQNSLPEEMKVSITSPLYGEIVKMLQKADKLTNAYDTLWMNGNMKSAEYNNRRGAIKRDIRSIHNFIRTTWVNLQSRISAEKSSKVEAAIGKEALAETQQEANALKEKRAPKLKQTQPVQAQQTLLNDATIEVPAAAIEA